MAEARLGLGMRSASKMGSDHKLLISNIRSKLKPTEERQLQTRDPLDNLNLMQLIGGNPATSSLIWSV